jgi:branched-chain amino acid transport system permease protein
VIAVLGVLLIGTAYMVLPLLVDDPWADIFVRAGYIAIAALGLNLLTGYTGQPSLGTAGFIAIGAFASSYLGRPADYGGLEWNFWAYTAVAVVIGGLIGFVVGLPALRLRGIYLSIATLAIVFVTVYALKVWPTVSGGNAGVAMAGSASQSNPLAPQLPIFDFLGIHWDFAALRVFGQHAENSRFLGRNQSLMYLVWGFVAVVALVCNNIVRSRPGRAMQAIRDRDVAAAVVGVSLFRYKVGAFVISSAIATLAGVFYGIFFQYATADDATFGLPLSILFLAVIIIGGIGTPYGPILGAILVAAIEPKIVPFLRDLSIFGHHVFSFMFANSPNDTGFTKGNFAALLYAFGIILFLIIGAYTKTNGLAGIVRRIGGYFRAWPLAR